jgi:hypothetical protein
MREGSNVQGRANFVPLRVEALPVLLEDLVEMEMTAVALAIS